mmetsp:Transcript_505/g.908  ORF Transcript_505/g.908 Transcript_505/m.908 type:complete len:87 (+) Transcript_505:624-884(+)
MILSENMENTALRSISSSKALNGSCPLETKSEGEQRGYHGFSGMGYVRLEEFSQRELKTYLGCEDLVDGVLDGFAIHAERDLFVGI